MKQITLSGRPSSVSKAMLILFLVPLAVFMGGGEARAQWATSGNNISNTNTGNVGVGTASPQANLHVATSSTTARGITNEQSSNDGNAAIFTFRKSRAGGTVVNGDSIGHFYGSASDGTTFLSPSRLTFSVDGPVATGSVPTSIQFFTGSSGNGVERLRITSAGKVGIGTVAPEVQLEVVGPLAAALRAVRDNGTADSATAAAATIQILNPNTTDNNFAGLSFQTYDTTGGTARPGAFIKTIFKGRTSTSVSADLGFSTANGGNVVEAMRITGAGNIGIGTASPSYKLDVTGPVRSSSGGFVFPDGSVQVSAASGTVSGVTAGTGLTGGGSAGSLTLNVGAGTGLSAGPDSLSVNYGSAAGTAVQGNIALTVTAGQGMTGGGQVTLGAGGTLTLTNSDRGSAQNIFKGVANASGAVQFTAGSNSDAISFEGTGGTTVSFNPTARRVTINSSAIAASGWTDGGASLSTTNSTASVGVGVTNPLAKLHVVGGARLEGAGRVYLGATAPSGARGLELVEENATTFSIRHHDPDVAWRNIAINPYAGKVGIGTLDPAAGYRLDVVGGVKVTHSGGASDGHLTVDGTITGGSIQAKYQDVAEWVPSVQKLAPGTVVILDSGRTNHVLASAAAYDTKVAGVVSAEPGIILGVAGEDKVMVATTGRVKVRVDATRGAIKVGDLLVTSGVEGLAMKSVPVVFGGRQMHAPGTIIGKALEPLEKGTGEILVLLSLQ